MTTTVSASGNPQIVSPFKRPKGRPLYQSQRGYDWSLSATSTHLREGGGGGFWGEGNVKVGFRARARVRIRASRKVGHLEGFSIVLL